MASVECDELKKVSSGKRKVESFAGEEEELCSCAAKKIDLSESKAKEKSVPVVSGAPTKMEEKKKMWLLPQEEAWVHDEYARKGFVEMDYDYFGERTEANMRCDQAREEVFGHWHFSSDSEDDDMQRLIKRTCRRFV
uniref:Uncharacterized protein n=1 Tax=Leersia perrieri TaxID=77586 RepID=A0A0D9WDJ0_9ORYZ